MMLPVQSTQNARSNSVACFFKNTRTILRLINIRKLKAHHDDIMIDTIHIIKIDVMTLPVQSKLFFQNAIYDHDTSCTSSTIQGLRISKLQKNKIKFLFFLFNRLLSQLHCWFEHLSSTTSLIFQPIHFRIRSFP